MQGLNLRPLPCEGAGYLSNQCDSSHSIVQCSQPLCGIQRIPARACRLLDGATEVACRNYRTSKQINTHASADNRQAVQRLRVRVANDEIGDKVAKCHPQPLNAVTGLQDLGRSQTPKPAQPEIKQFSPFMEIAVNIDGDVQFCQRAQPNPNFS